MLGPLLVAVLAAAAIVASVLMIEDQGARLRANAQADWEQRLLDVATQLRDEIERRGEDDIAVLGEVAESPTIALFLTEYLTQGGDLALIMDGVEQLEYIRNYLAVVAYDHGYAVDDALPSVAANLPQLEIAPAGEPQATDGGAEILAEFATEGIALVNLAGDTLVATDAFPPLTFDIRSFIQGADRAQTHNSVDFDSPDGRPLLVSLHPAFAFLDTQQSSTQQGWIVGLSLLEEIYDVSQLSRAGTDYSRVQPAALLRRGERVLPLSSIGAGGAGAAADAADLDVPAWGRAFESPGTSGISTGLDGVEVITASAAFAEAPVAVVASISVEEALSAAEVQMADLDLLLIPIGVLAVGALIIVWLAAAPPRRRSSA